VVSYTTIRSKQSALEPISSVCKVIFSLGNVEVVQNRIGKNTAIVSRAFPPRADVTELHVELAGGKDILRLVSVVVAVRITLFGGNLHLDMRSIQRTNAVFKIWIPLGIVLDLGGNGSTRKLNVLPI
jgi:hypothetical protein